MNKTLVSIALLAFVFVASAQTATDEIVVTPAKATTDTASGEFKNSCKVTFSNGMSDTAKCGGLVAVIDPREKLQCAPRANIVKKGDGFMFYKNPKDAGERITPCTDGAKVKS